jgi:hypothetical protein
MVDKAKLLAWIEAELNGKDIDKLDARSVLLYLKRAILSDELTNKKVIDESRVFGNDCEKGTCEF